MLAKKVLPIAGLILLITGILSGCNQQSADDIVVIGDANYRERIELPDDVIFEAAIIDITDADREAQVVSSYEKKNPGQPPLAYRLTYDKDELKNDRQYILRARILQKDQVLFTTQEQYNLSPGKAPTATSLRLIKVNEPAVSTRQQLQRDADRAEEVISETTQEMSDDIKSASQRLADATRGTASTFAERTKEAGAAAAAATKEVARDLSSATSNLAEDVKNSELVNDTKTAIKKLGNRHLEETYWRLSNIPAVTFTNQDLQQDAHIVLHKTNNHLTGSDGCNNLSGNYTLADDNQVKFTTITSTEKSCTTGINIAGAMSAVLTGTSHYLINGGTLELKNAAGTTLARFTAVDL